MKLGTIFGRKATPIPPVTFAYSTYNQVNVVDIGPNEISVTGVMFGTTQDVRTLCQHITRRLESHRFDYPVRFVSRDNKLIGQKVVFLEGFVVYFEDKQYEGNCNVIRKNDTGTVVAAVMGDNGLHGIVYSVEHV